MVEKQPLDAVVAGLPVDVGWLNPEDGRCNIDAVFDAYRVTPGSG